MPPAARPPRRPRLFAAAIALALAACDSAPPPILDGPARPALWIADDGDHRLAILGSVHQLPEDLDWQGGALAAEIARADTLLLELSPAESARAPALFVRMARDERVAPLDSRIGRAAATRARALAGAAGIDAAQADALESWALALAIGNAAADDAGLAAKAGVEARLGAAFAADDRPVRGLESAADQLGLFDALPPRAQDALLASVVAQADEARARTRRLLRAWATGDTAALAAATREEMARTPALAEPLIAARNRAWADTLATRLTRPGHTLVAVGAGHVVGEGSLIAELERRGVRVRRVQ